MSSSSGPPPPLPPYIVVFGPNANCTLELCPVVYSVYGYLPNLGANISFAVLFGIAFVVHTWMGIKGRNWFFMTCVDVGCFSAVIGYIGRIIMHSNPFNFIAFMIQLLGVGVAPVWYCAAIYVTLSDTIAYLSPGLSRLQPKAIYWIFIPCDLFSIIFQAVGTGMSARSRGVTQLGVNLALFGLAFQLFALTMFLVFFTDYLVRYVRAGNSRELNWRIKAFVGSLALATLLMVVRSAYRVYELREGFTGDAMRQEAPFIGIEGVPARVGGGNVVIEFVGVPKYLTKEA
ncbi:hypothetical protein DL764_002466 [Monosporascus ibericus]|uniref:RTA1 domain protein n=1 Tax=Monosporascus ibericus TaxID=155417 RepID=A0A4V1XBU4_9PEZI|nr:hypothetical protein DL764_002466 [Monosporascus ibericus]